MSSTAVIAVLVGIAVSAVQLALGTALGWWLHGKKQAVGSPTAPVDDGASHGESPPAAAAAPTVAPQTPSQVLAVQSFLTQLQELTGSVAQNVGEHNSQMSAFTEDLESLTISGASPEHVKLLSTLAEIVSANKTMQGKLSIAEARLQEQSQEIQSYVAVANTDALTGVANRRAFDEELKRRVEKAAATGEACYLAMLDVDHFKKFNDTYGHPAGDAVLREVARLLVGAAGPRDFVGRYGGEEFAVIASDLSQPQEYELVERIRQRIASHAVSFEGLSLNVTASLGVARADNEDSPETFLQRADSALYASKKGGRNCGHFASGQSFELINASAPQAKRKPEPAAALEQDSPDGRTDGMTGLNSRRAFSEELRRRVAEWRRSEAPLSVLALEIDKLSQLVSQRGSEAGNTMIRAVAQFLTASLREMDFVARYEGGKFVAILPDTTLEQGMLAAGRIRQAIATCDTIQVAGQPLRFTASAGVTEAMSGDDFAKIWKRAETTLAAAAEPPGNRACAHDGETIQTIGPVAAEG